MTCCKFIISTSINIFNLSIIFHHERFLRHKQKQRVKLANENVHKLAWEFKVVYKSSFAREKSTWETKKIKFLDNIIYIFIPPPEGKSEQLDLMKLRSLCRKLFDWNPKYHWQEGKKKKNFGSLQSQMLKFDLNETPERLFPSL